MKEIIKQLQDQIKTSEIRIEKLKSIIEELIDIEGMDGRKTTLEDLKSYEVATKNPYPKKEKKVGKEKKKQGKSKYTPVVIEFIVKKAGEGMNNKDLAEELNNRFNLDTTANGIAFFKSSNGIKRQNSSVFKKVRKVEKVPRVTKSNNKPYVKKKINKWSKEVFDFVKDNLHLKNKEIVEKINKKFGLNTTEKNLGVQMAHQGINRKKLNIRYRKAREPDMRKYSSGRKKKEIEYTTNKEIDESMKDIHIDDGDAIDEFMDEGDE